MGSSISSPARSEPAVQDSLAEKSLADLAQSLGAMRLREPASASGSISLDSVQGWEDKASDDPKVQLARTILVDTDFKTALASRYARVADPHVFNLQLEFQTEPITNQKSSGRCWLFATTNVLRHSIMQKLGLKEFQLSQSYVFFWDKLNKSNYFLELAIETADLPIDDRVVSYLSKGLISDGGQWDMAVNLLEVRFIKLFSSIGKYLFMKLLSIMELFHNRYTLNLSHPHPVVVSTTS